MEKTYLNDFDYIIFLDFEANCSDEQNFIHEIIQFPSIIYDVKNKIPLTNYNIYVKPDINPKLTDLCKQITKINQLYIDTTTLNLERALKCYDYFLSTKIDFKKDKFIIGTWGDWDLNVMLKNECEYKKLEYPSYLKKWFNVKDLCEDIIEIRPKTIIDFLNYFELQFCGTFHNGYDDCKNLMYGFKELLKIDENPEIKIKSL